MKTIAIAARHHGTEKYSKVFKSVYKYLQKAGKEVYLERHVAELMGLKKYQPFNRGKTEVDLVLVMGGDGTILSVVRQMRAFNSRIFGINMGTLGFMSEIPPVRINQTLAKIFAGKFTVDSRHMLHIEVRRNKKTIKKLHALNETVISQGTLARVIQLRTKVNGRKLTKYQADGSLSAGGPIMYPSIDAFILTPISPSSFTQKPIVIPGDKKIDITVESDHRRINLTIDGQESMELKYKDAIHIRRSDSMAQFVRLPTESFFTTLREKLHWGEQKHK
jgi:NAD+ kinase